jgi:hypothetical protein
MPLRGVVAHDNAVHGGEYIADFFRLRLQHFVTVIDVLPARSAPEAGSPRISSPVPMPLYA